MKDATIERRALTRRASSPRSGNVQNWLGATAAALALTSPLTADAQVFTGIEEGGLVRVERATNIQVLSLDFSARELNDADVQEGTWEVQLDLVVRNLHADDQVVTWLFDFADDFRGDTQIYLDGQPTSAREVEVSFDQREPALVLGEALRLDLAMESGRAHTMRLVTRVQPERVASGEQSLEFPLHHLNFGAPVVATRISLEPLGRPVAWRASQTHGTQYLIPRPELTWSLRDWSPNQRFSFRWLTPWSMLMRMAEVEACPDPWRVVSELSSGNLAQLRSILSAESEETLRFCANLPRVIHGYPFEDEGTRAQLGRVDTSRYLPGVPAGTPVYIPNPHFNEGALSEVERMYRSTLLTHAGVVE